MEALYLDCFKQLDPNIKLTVNKYDVFDYESETSLIELKCRRCSVNSYITTMVGANKIEYGLSKGKVMYFCFSFDDGDIIQKTNLNIIMSEEKNTFSFQLIF